MKRTVGVNCFGLNELIHNDFEKTFSDLKKIGFNTIEPMVVFPKTLGMDTVTMNEKLKASKKDGGFWPDEIAKGRIAYLRSIGFIVEGVHLSLVGMLPGGLGSILELACKFAVENDLKYVVHSPQKTTIEAIKKDVEDFKKGIDLFKQHDIELIFHQHHQEFTDDNGDTPFEYLLREVPELRIELDVGWLKFIDVDIIDTIHKYKDRIAILHLKDLVEDTTGKQEKELFPAVGEGCIPLKEIILEGDEINSEYTRFVIDQDYSFNDMMKDLEVGYNNIINV